MRRMNQEEKTMIENLPSRIDYLIQEKGYTDKDIDLFIAKLVYVNDFCYECRMKIWDILDSYINK